jgi:hypothetical protein
VLIEPEQDGPLDHVVVELAYIPVLKLTVDVLRTSGS